MARDTGPQCKQCRREGQKLFLKGGRCLTEKCGVERRSYPPGEHGRGRMRQSEYRQQLREKQKARRIYGVLERQFRQFFGRASESKGVTGEVLLQMLECRLDNVIYRLGFALSHHQARQLVRHGHFTVNGRKVDIPSYQVKAGDEIGVRERSRKMPVVVNSLEQRKGSWVPEWLQVSAEQMSGKVLNIPTRGSIQVPINEQLIVELYSK
jgi:small subunit ribosomal protein S4